MTAAASSQCWVRSSGNRLQAALWLDIRRKSPENKSSCTWSDKCTCQAQSWKLFSEEEAVLFFFSNADTNYEVKTNSWNTFQALVSARLIQTSVGGLFWTRLFSALHLGKKTSTKKKKKKKILSQYNLAWPCDADWCVIKFPELSRCLRSDCSHPFHVAIHNHKRKIWNGSQGNR